MKLKTKSSLLIGILTLGTFLGFFSLTVDITRAHRHKWGRVFTVSPSGEAGLDTQNIQAAFDDAIAAGPGSTVQLTAGQFYTNAIFVQNFNGKFKGAGKCRTKIDVLRGKFPEGEGVVGPYGNHLFTFEGGDVYISDLCFDITPEMPAEESYDGTFDLFTILIRGEIDSRIERVKFIGHEGDQSGYPEEHPLSEKCYNVRLGVEYGGATNGRHIITKCDFKSLWLGITAWMLSNCEMKIKSNSIKGNAIGIINAVNDNSKFEISRNYIETTYYGGIWVVQDVPVESASQWRITHNTVKVLSDRSDGIWLADFSSFKSLEAVVSYNKIILDHVNWGGIYTLFLQEAVISNNAIHGTGSYGIDCDFTNNSYIVGNTLSKIGRHGLVLYQSSENLIARNLIFKNGGFGLVLVENSNDNYIVGNVFHKNELGNVYDECNNKYKWNWGL